MKKRAIVFLLAALAITVATVLAFRTFNSEPQIEGRPLSGWVGDFRRGQPEQKRRAIEVLQAAGPEAAQYLARGLGKKPGFLDRAASRVGQHLPETFKKRLRKLYDPGKEILDQYSAVEALRLMGTNAQSAIPAVGGMLTNSIPLLSSTASRALVAMGPGAVGPLTKALDHPDFNVRSSACQALASLGAASAPAAPRLAQIVASEVGPILNSATYALARIGEAAIPHLVPLLNHTNASIRRQIASTFASMGANARPAIPTLLPLLDDPSPAVRAAALDGLGRMDPVSRPIASAAGQALEDPDPAVRSAALQLLRYRPRYVRDHAHRIASLLEDESLQVQGYAALALSSAPDHADRWLPRLAELAAAPDGALRAAAIEALRLIELTRAKSE